MNKSIMDKEKLAYEIARSLNDLDSIALHRTFVEQYSESHLRKCQMKALAYPDEKVRTSRGAIYVTLVRQHTH